MPANVDGQITWRPTAQSFVNLAAFLVTLGAAAAIVLGVTDSAELTGLTAALALVVGFGITLVVTRHRVAHALAEAETPDLGNWPGTPDERRDLKRRGWKRAGRSMAMACVVGALCGFYPVLGVACVGAGVAGGFSAAVVARTIFAFEAARGVTVMTPTVPKSPGGGRRRMRFGLAPGRL